MRQKKRSGATLVYVTFGMTIMIGFVSLVIDYGHVRLVKNQLQFAADAAARAGALAIPGGTTAAANAAASVAAMNTAGGTAVVLNQSTDIQFGTWSGGTGFTVLTGSAQSGANAIRITTRRTAATGNAIPLWFASLLGRGSFDVTASSIATYKPGEPAGLTGLNSITAGANLFVAAYDSAVTTTPSQSNFDGNNGQVYSNGPVSASSGSIHGNANLGPSGSVTGITVYGSTITGSTVAAPTVTMTVVTNPGGVSATPSLGSGITNWPGGTYYFTSFTMADNCTLNFTGPATIYMDGSVTIHDFNVITPYNGVPLNLMIYQSAGNTFTMHDSDSFTGCLVAPGADFTMSHDHCNWYGSVIARTVTAHDNDNFFYDEEVRQNTGSSIAIVQ